MARNGACIVERPAGLHFGEVHPGNRRADRIKILVWDGSGLVLVWKQLEGGAFRWPQIVDGMLRLTPVEFAALFDGIDWRRVQASREIPKPSTPA